MAQTVLNTLYDATEEELRFGIGLLAISGVQPVPLIHIHYRDWDRDKLELVRHSFHDGIDVAIGQPNGNVCDLVVSTKQRVAVEVKQNGHTSVLHGPAWNATLNDIALHVVRRFEADRRRSGFILLIQTPDWEFLAATDADHGHTLVGSIQSRSFPQPSS